MKVSKNKRLIQQNDFTQNANVAELMIDSCVRSPGYEAKKKKKSQDTYRSNTKIVI